MTAPTFRRLDRCRYRGRPAIILKPGSLNTTVDVMVKLPEGWRQQRVPMDLLTPDPTPDPAQP